ncbi:hypothetical protein THTE_3522 [Thermogutta terrifontis]|uniref:Uncharacterized protein n=1 Tax=Thermogutta terrifontis TaxID=1331910 RepID=A0A286RJI3_9BACT|nr:hypothetical protein THTE_3522 [Thermogutta terrifontis]
MGLTVYVRDRRSHISRSVNSFNVRAKKEPEKADFSPPFPA